MSTLGWIHTIFALIALLAGGYVVLARKGDRTHRTVGHMYLTSMLALNIMALFMYNLTGHINAFHIFAVISLINLALGMGVLFARRPRKSWLRLHSGFMSGSYVGLVAATAAEVTSRVPGWDFGLSVGLTSLIIIVVGAYLIAARTETAIANMRS